MKTEQAIKRDVVKEILEQTLAELCENKELPLELILSEFLAFTTHNYLLREGILGTAEIYNKMVSRFINDAAEKWTKEHRK